MMRFYLLLMLSALVAMADNFPDYNLTGNDQIAGNVLTDDGGCIHEFYSNMIVKEVCDGNISFGVWSVENGILSMDTTYDPQTNYDLELGTVLIDAAPAPGVAGHYIAAADADPADGAMDVFDFNITTIDPVSADFTPSPLSYDDVSGKTYTFTVPAMSIDVNFTFNSDMTCSTGGGLCIWSIANGVILLKSNQSNEMNDLNTDSMTIMLDAPPAIGTTGRATWAFDGLFPPATLPDGEADYVTATLTNIITGTVTLPGHATSFGELAGKKVTLANSDGTATFYFYSDMTIKAINYDGHGGVSFGKWTVANGYLILSIKRPDGVESSSVEFDATPAIGSTITLRSYVDAYPNDGQPDTYHLTITAVGSVDDPDTPSAAAAAPAIIMYLLN